jgi:hypothetical protein
LPRFVPRCFRSCGLRRLRGPACAAGGSARCVSCLAWQRPPPFAVCGSALAPLHCSFPGLLSGGFLPARARLPRGCS